MLETAVCTNGERGETLSDRRDANAARPQANVRPNSPPSSLPTTAEGPPSSGITGIDRLHSGLPEAPGLARTRLLEQLARVFDTGLGLVRAPAGWGKTTLLAHFAESCGAPVVWVRAGASAETTTESGMARQLWSAVARLGGSLSSLLADTPWSSAAEVARGMEIVPVERLLVVIDDFHMAIDSPAERLVEGLADEALEGIAILLASRSEPGINVSRRRVEGRILEIDTDDLRFRTWEVEKLFSDFYDTRLSPEDVASLARRTDGWAACLQLFRLATEGKPPAKRRQVLDSLHTRSRLVRDYLARNVLDELPADLRDFLVRICVLDEATASLCDELLERSDSVEKLEELELRHLLTSRLDGDEAYHCHEVLRSQLEGELARQLGDQRAREEHRRAGVLLEKAGNPTGALQAYLRAGDLEAARLVLGDHGDAIAAGPGTWLDLLPRNLVAFDPWVHLTRARLLVSSGSLARSIDSYRRAEESFELAGASAMAAKCVMERKAVDTWMNPDPSPQPHLMSIARAALRSAPRSAAEMTAGMHGPMADCVRGMALCLAGQTDQGRALIADAASSENAPPTLAVTLGAVELAIRSIGSYPANSRPAHPAEVSELDIMLAGAESEGPVWIARMLSALATLVAGRPGPSAGDLVSMCDADGDDWGAALVHLMEGIGLMLGSGYNAPDPSRLPASQSDAGEPLLEAARRFRDLLAGSLESVALALAALTQAREGHQSASSTLAQAEEEARSYDVPLAASICASARVELSMRSLTSPEGSDLSTSGAPGALLGSSVTGSRAATATATASKRARKPEAPGEGTRRALRCLGALEVAVNGVELDMHLVKPKARKLLGYLALNVDHPVHREQLVEIFWPGASLASGLRNLQVSISSLRTLTDHSPKTAGGTMIEREGDAYCLRTRDATEVDLRTFDQLRLEASRLLDGGKLVEARAAFEGAAAVYRGELLPDFGPEDWIVEPREHLKVAATKVAEGLARSYLAEDDFARAIGACEWGLQIDRYHDGLWKLTAVAHRDAGNEASAARVESRYQQVLDELGVA